MATIKSINPSSLKVIGSFQASSKKEIQQKVTDANTAKKSWKEIGIKKRISLVEQIYQALKKHKQELSKLATQEMGMSISNMLGDADDSLAYIKWYCDHVQQYTQPEVTYEDDKMKNTVYFEPIGTVASISPWNFPFSNFVWHVIPNLLVGNTVIFKHSEECGLFAKQLESFCSQTDLPKGVLSFVHGDGAVGDLLVQQEIDLIHFTGSTKTGQYLYQTAAKKMIRVVLELGGSAPGIVLQDADISRVAESIFWGRFFNTGQVCDGLKRLIVHSSKYDEMVKALKNFISNNQPGDPLNKQTEIGPMVAMRQVELLKEQLVDAEKKGAKVLIGGKQPAQNPAAFFDLTLVSNIKPSMRIWKEEVFGPVLPIVTFDTEDEAISLANDTSYGLGAYVYTSDKQHALDIAKNIKSGGVTINNSDYVKPSSPFGGCKCSGIGREHGRFGFLDLCELKTIAMEK
jgi:succinate-semialdehyde dehydrogenase/glutarate-semialdehyde dehydrogenase